jgi:hypothetical protein
MSVAPTQRDAERSLDFTMVSSDPILRAYAGSVSVVAAPPAACVLHMHQEAEGKPSIVAAVAGATVLQHMLTKQTGAMLRDFKRAAEAGEPAPSHRRATRRAPALPAAAVAG